MSSASGLINKDLNEKIKNDSKKKDSFLLNFLVGATSESIAKTITAPIERIKILLQGQQVIDSLKVKYTGTYNCLYRVIYEQGFFALWRGNMVNITKYVPTFALNYSLKELFQKKLKKSHHSQKVQIGINFLSGAFSGGVTLLVTYPLDFSRTKIAVDISSSSRNYKGIIDCWKFYYPQHGIQGIYSGFTSCFIGIIVYRGSVFGCYDSFMHIFPNQNSLLFKYLFSVLVSGVAGMISLPLDTIRRRMIIEVGREVKEYEGSNLKCFKRIYKIEGYKGFFKGGSANFLRSFGSALTLIMNDYIVDFYKAIII